MVKLNPYAMALKRSEAIAVEHREKGMVLKERRKKKIDAKKEHDWRKKYNYRRIATESNIVITKDTWQKRRDNRRKKIGKRSALLALKKKKLKEEKKFKAHVKALKEKARGEKGSQPLKEEIKKMQEIKKMIVEHLKEERKKYKAERRLILKGEGNFGKKKGVSGAKVSKSEQAVPFKTYDNDEIIGKELR